jgi:hypothetical protein
MSVVAAVVNDGGYPMFVRFRRWGRTRTQPRSTRTRTQPRGTRTRTQPRSTRTRFDPRIPRDGWLRRRVRMCYWKQRRHPRTKVKNLVALGVSLDLAIQHAVRRKKYWRMSHTPALRYAMPNEWLEQQG